MENQRTTALNTTESGTKRHPTNESAVIEIYGRSGKVHCRMSNLSLTGAFFEITNAISTPKQGDVVRVTVNLKQVNKSHVVHGQVIWCRGLGLGVAFIKNNELLKRIKK